MIPRSSLRVLRSSERLAWRGRYVQKGKCIRCLHASRKLLAEAGNNANDAGTPHNTPDKGPARHQREAMNTDEVKMAMRDHPSPSFGEPDANTLRPPGASKTVDPEAVGENVSPGRMGENDAPTQEGPLAQGVGRVAAEEDIADTSNMARGVRSPGDGVEDPAKGGAAVLESSDASPMADANEVERPPAGAHEDAMENPAQNDAAVMESAKRTTVENVDDVEAPQAKLHEGVVVRDEHVPSTTAEVTAAADHASHSVPKFASTAVVQPQETAIPATWKRGDQDASLQEHINAAFGTSITDTFRNTSYLAGRLVNGQPIRFKSCEEKAAAEELAAKIVKSRAERVSGTKPPAYKTASIPESVPRNMASAMVAGKHGDFEALKKAASGKDVRDSIVRQVIMNDTYLRSDRERLLSKVQSLLPASSRTAARK